MSMPSQRLRLALLAVILALGAVAFGTGCSQKEPKPTVSGYFEGPMKPKSEVAPAPGAGAKPKAGGPAAAGDL